VAQALSLYYPSGGDCIIGTIRGQLERFTGVTGFPAWLPGAVYAAAIPQRTARLANPAADRMPNLSMMFVLWKNNRSRRNA
jgi:hypothetical protein